MNKITNKDAEPETLSGLIQGIQLGHQGCMWHQALEEAGCKTEMHNLLSSEPLPRL